MRKDLKKNKKGFTLVEIIVVLLIIGILLAITIPSIMGYVGQAKDAQYEAEARSGYVAAQTILAREVSGKTTIDDTAKGNIIAKINSPLEVAKELGEADKNDTKVPDTATVKKITCELTSTGTALTGCSIQTAGSGEKWVNFTAATATEASKTDVSKKATYPTTTDEGETGGE